MGPRLVICLLSKQAHFPSKLFKLLPHLSPHLLLGICPPSPPIPSQCRQCSFNVLKMASQCPQQITPFRSQAPNEMRLRQRVKGSHSNLPLEACLSSTGWYVWKSRRLAALSHVTIAVGAPGPCHLSQSHAWHARAYISYMGLEPPWNGGAGMGAYTLRTLRWGASRARL